MFNIHDVIAQNLPVYNAGVKLTDNDRARLEEKAALLNQTALVNIPKGVTQSYNPTIATPYVAKVKNCPYPRPNTEQGLGMIIAPKSVSNLSFDSSKLGPITGYAIAPITPQLKPIVLPSTSIKNYIAPTVKESVTSQITRTLSPSDSLNMVIAKAATKAAEIAINNSPSKEKFLEQKAIDAKKLELYNTVITPTITGSKNNASVEVVSDVKRTAPMDGMMHTMMPGQEVVNVSEKKVDLMKLVPVAILLWNMM